MLRHLGKILLVLWLLTAAGTGQCLAQKKGPETINPISVSETYPILYDASLVFYNEPFSSVAMYNNAGYSLLSMDAVRNTLGLSFDVWVPRLTFISAGVGFGAMQDRYKSKVSWSGQYSSMDAFRLVPDIHIALDATRLYLRGGLSWSILVTGSYFKDPDPIYSSIGPDCLTPTMFSVYWELGARIWRFNLAIGARTYYSDPFDIERLTYYHRYQYRSGHLSRRVLFFKIGFQLFSNHL